MSWLVDTDPAAGLPFRDVDDAIAIWTMRRAITGLTTVFGNSTGPRTHAVAVELGQRLGFPVHRGADHPGDVDTAAVAALVAHTGPVLAIGPMTNIAAALRRGARWPRLVILGGTDRRLPNLRPLHTTELNFMLDVDAAGIALAHTTTLVPMEVCRTVWFDRTDVAQLPAWLAARCAGWMRLAPVLTGRRAFHPWDVVAALVALDSPGLRVERRTVRLAKRPGYVVYGDGHELDVLVAVDDFRARWGAARG